MGSGGDSSSSVSLEIDDEISIGDLRELPIKYQIVGADVEPDNLLYRPNVLVSEANDVPWMHPGYSDFSEVLIHDPSELVPNQAGSRSFDVSLPAHYVVASPFNVAFEIAPVEQQNDFSYAAQVDLAVSEASRLGGDLRSHNGGDEDGLLTFQIELADGQQIDFSSEAPVISDRISQLMDAFYLANAEMSVGGSGESLTVNVTEGAFYQHWNADNIKPPPSLKVRMVDDPDTLISLDMSKSLPQATFAQSTSTVISECTSLTLAVET